MTDMLESDPPSLLLLWWGLAFGLHLLLSRRHILGSPIGIRIRGLLLLLLLLQGLLWSLLTCLLRMIVFDVVLRIV